MTRKEIVTMSFAPHQTYHSNEEYQLTIFDVRIPEAADRLHRERAYWRERGDLEAIDEAHFVLAVRHLKEQDSDT